LKRKSERKVQRLKDELEGEEQETRELASREMGKLTEAILDLVREWKRSGDEK
jgi:hypothetical protein